MAYTRFLFASAILAVASAQSCPSTPYYPLDCTNKCAPSHDFELTLGNVTLEQARIECKEECTAFGDDCAAVLIETRDVTKCLLYSSVPAPQTCAQPCKLEGYTKDNILPCYTASSIAATSYCNSVLKSTVTKTATVTPGASTRIANSTLTTFLNQTAILTRTIDATTTLSITTTLFTSPTVTTNVNILPTTTVLTTTTTGTVTATATVTTTLVQAPRFKRNVVPPPACATDTPAKLSSACVVYNAEPTTITTTTTLGQTFVTRTNNLTLTLTRPVTATVSVTVTSITDTAIVPTTIVDGQTFFTTTTAIDIRTATKTTFATTTVTTTTTQTIFPSVDCGLPQGYVITGRATGTVSCTPIASPSSNPYVRIEGRNGAVFEGCVAGGPRDITTPSGGTHKCDSTNNNANPSPFNNGITAIDAAARLKNFGYDGTWSPQFQDFFIQTIGDTPSTGSSFWGILNNGAFTPAGGCETAVSNTDRLLWAFNAFNVNFFLRVEPEFAVALPGDQITLTVTGTDGSSGSYQPISGASIAGKTTDGNGRVTIDVPAVPGCYQYKATRADSIRSNRFSLSVFSSF